MSEVTYLFSNGGYTYFVLIVVIVVDDKRICHPLRITTTSRPKSNTFYCECHKGEVYIAQQSFTSCAKQIYIIGREVEVKLDSKVKQNNVLAFIRN
jgi:hypothetical protein